MKPQDCLLFGVFLALAALGVIPYRAVAQT